MTVVRDYVPRGNTLESDSFRRRHLLLCWVLGLHLPALFVFGVWQGFGLEHSALEMVTPGACLLCARFARNRRLAAFFVTAGLVFCSSVLVHISGGTIEAHFHFFILIGLIALYQDWVPFLWNVIFTVISHGLGSSIAADLMYNHPAAQNRPWSWAAIHGVAVLAACVGVIIFWKNTEIEQQRSMALAVRLAAAQTEAAQRQTVAELFVSLARRNQALLGRQMELIADLEQREREPEALSELFKLDHLATRIRRNAESLLVLAGDDPPRRWGRPVRLGEVVRAAAAEVEDYQRVNVMVNDHLQVAGRAVSDLAHLLAELIENATRFSPPGTEVWVRSYVAPGDHNRCVVSVEDSGIGMTDDDMQAANSLLAEPPQIDLRGLTLGFQVVSRLARRYRMGVCVAGTPGGGVTALVSIPDDLVDDHRRSMTVASSPASGPHRPTTALVAATATVTTTPTATATVTTTPTATPTAQAQQYRAAPPIPALPQPALGIASAPFEQPTPPPPPPNGLVQRVPGTNLPASLRPRSTAPGSPPKVDGRHHDARRPAGASPNRDREHVRSMLSRFQASQRAARAVAEAPPGSLAHRPKT